jgi:hypothetical protein
VRFYERSFASVLSLPRVVLLKLGGRYYVLSIKGCKRDDYDYAEVNRLLNIDLKRFIKKVKPLPGPVFASSMIWRLLMWMQVSCTPEMITKADGWVSIGASFAASEKVDPSLPTHNAYSATLTTCDLQLHINLLATEARRQVAARHAAAAVTISHLIPPPPTSCQQCELLHAFNAVNRFLSR